MQSRPTMPPGGTPLFVSFVVLTFYGLGAGYVESFVNYPLWYIVGESDRWVEYHRALGPRVLVFLAVPVVLLSLVVNALLFVRRPPAVPAWTVTAALSLLLIIALSTIVIQIPIQIALGAAFDRAALDRLITSSLWLRDVPGTLRAGIIGYMLYLVASRSAGVPMSSRPVGGPDGDESAPIERMPVLGHATDVVGRHA